MFCPIPNADTELNIWCFGIMIFLFVWIIFVPVAVTARLEKIIRLLQEKQDKQYRISKIIELFVKGMLYAALRFSCAKWFNNF